MGRVSQVTSEVPFPIVASSSVSNDTNTDADYRSKELIDDEDRNAELVVRVVREQQHLLHTT